MSGFRFYKKEGIKIQYLREFCEQNKALYMSLKCSNCLFRENKLLLFLQTIQLRDHI